MEVFVPRMWEGVDREYDDFGVLCTAMADAPRTGPLEVQVALSPDLAGELVSKIERAGGVRQETKGMPTFGLARAVFDQLFDTDNASAAVTPAVIPPFINRQDPPMSTAMYVAITPSFAQTQAVPCIGQLCAYGTVTQGYDSSMHSRPVNSVQVSADDLWRAADRNPADPYADELWYGPRDESGNPVYVTRQRFRPGTAWWDQLRRFLGDSRSLDYECVREERVDRTGSGTGSGTILWPPVLCSGRSATMTFYTNAKGTERFPIVATVSYDAAGPHLSVGPVDDSQNPPEPPPGPAFTVLPVSHLRDRQAQTETGIGLREKYHDYVGSWGGRTDLLVGAAGLVVLACLFGDVLVTLEWIDHGARLAAREYAPTAGWAEPEILAAPDSVLPISPINVGWPRKVCDLRAQQWLRSADGTTTAIIFLLDRHPRDGRTATVSKVVETLSPKRVVDLFHDPWLTEIQPLQASGTVREHKLDYLGYSGVADFEFGVFVMATLARFRDVVSALCTHHGLRFCSDAIPRDWFDDNWPLYE